jgi:CIC family chloride channel protein
MQNQNDKPSAPLPSSAEQQPMMEAADNSGSLLVLALLSLLVGAAAGLVGALFRLSLLQADQWRKDLITWAHGEDLAGLLVVVTTCTAGTAVAAWLVCRFFPHASGSGIPHVEAVLDEELPPAPFRMIPVKFFGGLLAIGSGLALGREGPSVQMGAGVAYTLGRLFRRGWQDSRILLAAGAGAGLATAFNAPIAGAVFVLEELVRRFDTRITIATCGASAAAMAVARLFLGVDSEFQVEAMAHPEFGELPLFLALGVFGGLLGVAYNQTLLGTFKATGRLSRWPVELRAGIVGSAVGLVAWFLPDLVGGGDPITQRTLAGPEPLGTLVVVFLLRFGLGAVSYAARTPGGLFAPLLVLGAQSGLLFGMVCADWLPAVAGKPMAAAVVGMAAFFTAVVRAPVTGIILVIEMTCCFTLLLPMLTACFAAMLVPTLLGDPPIYTALREKRDSHG